MANAPRTKYETRLPLQLFEDACDETPERPFCLIPRSDRPRDGHDVLTFGRTRELVDSIAHFIDAALPSTTRASFPTVAYIGPSDVRYILFQYASIKCRVKVLLPSLRNTPEVNSHLINVTNCDHLFHANERSTVASQLKAITPTLELTTVSNLTNILTNTSPHIPYPYTTTFTSGLNDPIAILHSSGSTGLPKPITLTNGFIATLSGERSYAAPPGRTKAEKAQHDFSGAGGTYVAPFPPFHLAGVTELAYCPLYTVGTPVWLAAGAPPTAEAVLEVIQLQRCKGAYLPPSLIEQIYHLKSGSEVLARLEWLFYGGGPLSDAVGDDLSRLTRIGQFFGGTEFLKLNQLLPRREDWAYLEFHPEALQRMEETDEGAYELVVLADPLASGSYAGRSGINHTMPGVAEYRTKDLFVPHPIKPGLWKFYGRRDDILVLSSGEKINPLGMEAALTGSGAGITGALVVGERQYRPALLVEVGPDLRQRDDVVEILWPEVEKANESASAAGRISKDLVIVSRPDRPFIRAGKGTVIRRATTRLYEREIQSAYEQHESGTNGMMATGGLNLDESSVLDMIRSAIRAAAVPIADDDANIFLAGCDSLKAVDITTTLRKSLGMPSLTQNLLYRNPSVSQLAQAVISQTTPPEGVHFRDTSELRDLLAAYTLPLSRRPQADISDGRRIAITGTTGTLGNFLLTSMAQNPKISTIICLNRSPDAARRWLESSPVTSPSTSIRFLDTVSNKPHLGLDDEQIESLASCDAIIHNAWKVDFLQPASSFAENLHATRELLSICSRSTERRSKPRFIFISSISSCGRLDRIPESAVTDLGAALPMGYAESKLIGEQIVNQAAATEHIPAAVLRVGQVAGSTQLVGPRWPDQEAVPGLWRTSRALKLVPDDLAPANWIPVNVLAEQIAEIALQRQESIVYYNLVHPRPTPWSSLLEALKEWCGPETATVPLSDWVRKLAESDVTDQKELKKKPALKVLDFWQEVARRRGENTRVQVEDALRDVGTFAATVPINADLLKMWLAKL